MYPNLAPSTALQLARFRQDDIRAGLPGGQRRTTRRRSRRAGTGSAPLR